MNTARCETPVEPIPTPAVIEARQTPDSRLCLNPRCKKGPNRSAGIVKSRRAKYCCSYCRVDVCRRNRPKPEQAEKPTRKRRRDAKYASHSERQRAYQARHSLARHSLAGYPEGIRDLVGTKARRAGMADTSVPESV